MKVKNAVYKKETKRNTTLQTFRTFRKITRFFYRPTTIRLFSFNSTVISELIFFCNTAVIEFCLTEKRDARRDIRRSLLCDFNIVVEACHRVRLIESEVRSPLVIGLLTVYRYYDVQKTAGGVQ